MDNTKLLEQYLDKNNVSDRTDIKSYLSKIVEYCDTNNISLLKITDKEVDNIYKNENWSETTKSNHKFFILGFLKYCGNPIADLEITCVKNHFYNFKSIEDVFVPYMDEYSENMNKNSTPMIVCILAWYFHINKDDFIDIKNYDVDILNDNTITIKGRKIQLPEHLYSFFIKYYYASYFVLNNGKKIAYTDDYFIKIKNQQYSSPNKIGGDDLQTRKKNIFKKLRSFNISYADVYWDGIFNLYRAYQSHNGTLKFSEFIYNLDNKQDMVKFNLKIKDYENYKLGTE